MSVSASYIIRPLTSADQTFLWEMLYHSLYVPDGGQAFAREIVDRPEIARYVQGWGREQDAGFVAEIEPGRSVGAVWMRLFEGEERGYGYVDERTPEIGMAVLPEYRGLGLGTSLLRRLVKSAAGVHERVTLSVGVANPARRLYEREGFEAIGERDSSLTMQKDLKGNRIEAAT